MKRHRISDQWQRLLEWQLPMQRRQTPEQQYLILVRQLLMKRRQTPEKRQPTLQRCVFSDAAAADEVLAGASKHRQLHSVR